MKEFIFKHKKIIIIVTLLFTLFIFSIISFNVDEEEYEEAIVEKVVESQTDEEEVDTIKVDIKGEIVNSGVYELDSGQRVSDLIEKAGGLTKNADTSLLNLSKVLKDEMVVIIYSKSEVEELKNVSNTECVCPTENDACITTEADEVLITNSTETTGKISINTATLEELQTLTGIGEAKARAIINYRLENGNFNSIEDIKNVSGIGDSIYEQIKDDITV